MIGSPKGYRTIVEPIPETARAIEQYGPFVIENEDLLVELLGKAEQVRAIVPQCLGVSLASNEDEVTFTVVASAKELAVLDAVQYLADGPCVQALRDPEVLPFEQGDPLDEETWRLFSEACGAAGVASTLTLPILDGKRVLGSVNLYASESHAFDRHHEEVADIFGAWAPGAVTNADLSFSTRAVAARAPDVLREELDLTVASGMIAVREGVDINDASRLLRDAAVRAGVSELELARTIIEVQRSHDADDKGPTGVEGDGRE
jgi:GAF domain-containing protein